MTVVISHEKAPPATASSTAVIADPSVVPTGNFVIKGAPAGKYHIVMWQEETGYFLGEKTNKGVPVEIKAGAMTDLGKFELKP